MFTWVNRAFNDDSCVVAVGDQTAKCRPGWSPTHNDHVGIERLFIHRLPHWCVSTHSSRARARTTTVGAQ